VDGWWIERTNRVTDERHIDQSAIIELLGDDADAALPSAWADHLSVCPECAAVVVDVREMVRLIRDDSVDAPDTWIERAAASPFRQGRTRQGSLRRLLASIRFDSAVAPAPALARRAGGDARQLVLRAESWEIELRIAPGGSRERWPVSGQLFRLAEGETPSGAPAATTANLSALSVSIRSDAGQRAADRVSTSGEFLIDRRPETPFSLVLEIGSTRIETPIIDPDDG
jgi:hypothetical protein